MWPCRVVLVTFSTTGALVATPASATTDASGVAVTQVTAGTVAGTGTITAVTSGVQTPVSASVAVNAGSVTSLVVSPKTLRLAATGDTARIVASVQDQFGNSAGASAVTFAAVDSRRW